LAGTDLPLFGLQASWRGTRTVSEAGGVIRNGRAVCSSMTLTHRDPDGGTLDVEVHRHLRVPDELRPDLATRLWREAAVEPPGAGPDAVADFVARRETELASGEIRWSPVDVPVDGASTWFSALVEGERWAAHGEAAEACLVLRFPIACVDLIRLRALDAYLRRA
jgi:hypothetical protein